MRKYVRYDGRDGQGLFRSGGAGVESVIGFVQEKHQQGWRDLRVLDRTNGELVGWIRRGSSGRRGWWAEEIPE